MTLRGLALAVLAMALAIVCLRLGFWQLSRWNEKHRVNVRARALLSEPLRPIGSLDDAAGVPAGARVLVTGRFVDDDQLLLSARMHAGEPGVEWVTPLRLASGGLVLVRRGWLPAADSRTAAPEPDEARPETLTGLLEAPPAAASDAAWSALPSAHGRLWSAYELDGDTIRTRLALSRVPVVIRALPGPGAPSYPVRELPEPANESMHMGYAVQWFGFAALLALGAIAALLRRPGVGGSPVA